MSAVASLSGSTLVNGVRYGHGEGPTRSSARERAAEDAMSLMIELEGDRRFAL